MNEDLFSYINPAAQQNAQGVLGGVRIAVQPNLNVRGWPTCAGSKALEGFRALEDAAIVEQFGTAGAYIAGYSRMPELGFGQQMDTGAAAVVSGRCDIAIINDTMGEARAAAAASALVGFKPSAGAVSVFGLTGLVPSGQAPGVVAGNAELIERVLSAIICDDERDFTMDKRASSAMQAGNGVDSAIVISQCLAGLGDTERKAVDNAIKTLEGCGIGVREVSFDGYRMLSTVYQVISAVEASSAAGKYDSVRYGHRTKKADNWNEMYIKSRGEAFGSAVKALLFRGAYFQFEDYAAFENACRLRRELAQEMDELLGSSAVLLSPTLRGSSQNSAHDPAAEVFGTYENTLTANLCGLPAVSLPGIAAEGSQDFGLQLVGRRFGDGALLKLAARVLSCRGEGL